MSVKISFVIPAYNEEVLLELTLRSVLSEMARVSYPCEIIVVDNNSTDRTAEIAAAFGGVQVIFEPTPGVVAARRAGYQAAVGEFIANLDADVLLPVGWIDRGLAHFVDPALVALSGPYRYIGVSRSTDLLIRSYYGLAYLLYLVVRACGWGSMIQGGNALVRRDALDRADAVSDDFTFYGEDTELARCLAQVGVVRFSLRFWVYSSARRFRGEGLVRTGLTYTANYFSTILCRRPWTRQWRNHRLG